MRAAIREIRYHLPAKVLTNENLAEEYPDWSVEKIEGKTGIVERHIAGPRECASDLAVAAALKLFEGGACRPSEIDYLLFCTQSPDYFVPTTACLLQERLGLSQRVGALDINLGCSGYIYGLGLAQGLISTGQASRILFLTADTYSKFIHPKDRSVRTLFGDAGAATLIEASADSAPSSRPAYVFGTDGLGASQLMVPAGGLRRRPSPDTQESVEDDQGNWRSQENLFMNGPEVFQFASRVVPECISQLLAQTRTAQADVDLFIFHQANQFMLDYLRRKLAIPPEKFFKWLRLCGNTVSCTIPIAISHALAENRLKPRDQLMLVGFGTGYSWGATLLEWPLLG